MPVRCPATVLFVEDMEAARAFYEGLLGLSVQLDLGCFVGYEGNLWLWLRSVAEPIIFGDAVPVEADPGAHRLPALELAIEADDLRGVWEKMAAAGVEPVHPIVEQPWGQLVFRVYDPDHNIFEVGEPTTDTPSYRTALEAGPWDRFREFNTDQQQGIDPPPVQKPVPEGARRVDLVSSADFTVGRRPLIEAIGDRRSRRKFSGEPLTLEELSFLLWATQGVTGDGPARRAAPSAGARDPFETYLYVTRVEELEPGLYRYLPVDHQLLFLAPQDDVAEQAEAAWGSPEGLWGSAVIFVWTALPYRTAWRYGQLTSKLIALDAGHVCHALYLACEGIGAGTCAIGAYDQAAVDAVVGVGDTHGREEELVVYMAPVGKLGVSAVIGEGHDGD